MTTINELEFFGVVYCAVVGHRGATGSPVHHLWPGKLNSRLVGVPLRNLKIDNLQNAL